LSQIESGARPHLTNTTRQTLAGFFKVHPGYLVDDPGGLSPGVAERCARISRSGGKLDLWLVDGAEKFRRDAVLKHALLTLARHEQSRDCLLLLEAILETPGLMPRLMEVLRPSAQQEDADAGSSSNREPLERGKRQAGEKEKGGKTMIAILPMAG
jgi:hypothetical protein